MTTPHYLRKCIFSLVAISAIVPLLSAQTTGAQIALWTFEDWEDDLEHSPTIGPITPETGSGSATGWHINSVAWSQPAGHGSGQSLSSTNWEIGDYYQFQISTLGLVDIEVGWAMTRSDSASETWNFDYSLNGTDFTTYDSFTVGTSGWGTTSSPAASVYLKDLSEVVGLNDQPSVFIRLSAASVGDSSRGAVRIDDVSMTAIPEPGSVALFAGLIAGGAIVIRRRLLRK